jgi:hypothetical protein
MAQEERFWETVQAYASQAARKAAPPFIAYAVAAGGASTAVTVGAATTYTVPMWLNGVEQTEANKTQATLQYGQTAPAAGELWLVLLPNYQAPGVLLLRIA